MAAGSVKNFFSFNSTLLNGVGFDVKPWNDTGWLNFFWSMEFNSQKLITLFFSPCYVMLQLLLYASL